MFVVIAFIFGLLIGSFLNSVLYRLARGGNIARERSHCPHCQSQLAWFELMPLLSFICQLGKCRTCQKQISWQYPLIELVVAVLFAAAYLSLEPATASGYLELLSVWLYISVLVVIFTYDLRYKLILDKVAVPAMVAALALTFVLLGLAGLWSHLVAGLVAGGFFLIQFIVSRGRWIGGGDIRLGLLMGFMLGWPEVLAALFLAYILGALVATVLVLARRQTWSGEIAFGTFLSLGTVATLLYGAEIINWYLNLL